MQSAGILHGPAHSASRQAQAFTRSVDLDSGRLYSRVQCGNIRLALGEHPEAIAAFEAALEQRPGFGPASEGAAAALLAAARSHQSFGAPGGPPERPTLTTCNGQAKHDGCMPIHPHKPNQDLFTAIHQPCLSTTIALLKVYMAAVS